MRFKKTLEQATQLINQSQFNLALAKVDSILQQEPNHQPSLKLKVKIGFTSKQLNIAEQALIQLNKLVPDNFQYIGILENLFSQDSRWIDICTLYSQYVYLKPSHAIAQFNYAYYLKLTGKFELAITHYNLALSLNISDPFEIYLNIAVIYNEHLNKTAKAIEILTLANQKYPKQDAVLYNLANIYEQHGDKVKALEYFKKAYEINPQNTNALARQADISRIKSKDDALITDLYNAFKSMQLSKSDKINVAYALGKSLDDCKEYKQAFDLYEQANKMDADTLPIYDACKIEQQVDSIIATFNKGWFNSLQKTLLQQPFVNAKRCPTFICGMFRSGSTLCEQVLAAHEQVMAGGEQEFFHRTVKTRFNNFPEGVDQNVFADAAHIRKQYLDEVYKSVDETLLVTDKRPDNFLYIGLIKSILPEAKVIWTKRQLLDNCLSVYFLRLGASMNYATNLVNIMHFYQQQERLMSHWMTLFPEDILEFSYDKLIASPQESINKLLMFLELPLDQNCLAFHRVKNQVKTASVWQVRQPLYSRSSNRWLNYAEQLTALNIGQT